MSIFAVAYFREKCIVGNNQFIFPKNSIAVPPLPDDKKSLKSWDDKRILYFDANDVFTDYTKNPDANIIFTHIGGGIGDIIAFSAIADYFKGKSLTVHLEQKFFPIFKWFTNQNVKLRGYYDPIIVDFTPANRVTKYRHYARLRLEKSAIESGPDNWYDGFFRRIGLKEAPESLKRPKLIHSAAKPSKFITGKKTVIISHRSSCQMRSGTFKDFYFAVKSVLPDHEVYVHDIDLVDADRYYINKSKLKITIIPKCSISDYLDNLYAASMVVCTDTSAIHFREGVEKPCLAVFGAMTAESRVSGHKFTKGFNAVSDCPFQPCFIHETKKGMVCKNAASGDLTAKCITGMKFRKQLTEELEKYVKSCIN